MRKVVGKGGGEAGSGELGRWERWEGSVLERWERCHGWEDSWATKLERLEGSDVATWERWEGRGVVRRWQGGKGARVVRWERWDNGEVARWEVPGCIQEWGHRVSPRFHLFVSDVDQRRNKGAG